MATKTWVGSSGASWNDDQNWSPAGVPGPTDAVIIPAGSGTVAVTAGASAGSVSVGAASNLSLAATLQLGDGTTAQLGNLSALTLLADATLTLAGGTLAGGTLDLTANGGLVTAPSLTDTTLLDVRVLGGLAISDSGFIRLAGSTLVLAADGVTPGEISKNGGLFVIESAGPLTLDQHIAISSVGLLPAAPAQAPQSLTIGALGSVTGSGAIAERVPGFSGTLDLVNQGLIEAQDHLADPSGSNQLSIIAKSFTNAGTLRAGPGAILSIGNADGPLTPPGPGEPGRIFTNLDATGTLTGGVYDVIDGGRIQIVSTGGDPDVVPVTSLKALLAVAQGGQFTVNGVAIEASLAEIGDSGTLGLFSRDMTFASPTGLGIAGFLNLQGSNVTSTGGFTLAATGFVGGYGTMTGTVVNNGAILAAGVVGSETLTLDGAISGTGTLEVTGVSTLQIAGAVSAGQSLIFSDTVESSSETVRLLSSIDTFDATINGFGAGDIIELEFGAATEAVVRSGEANLLDVFNGSQLLGTLVFGTDLTGQQFSVTAENDVDGQGYLITLGAPPFVPTYDGVWQVYGPDNFDYGSLFFGGTPVAVSLQDLGGGRQRYVADYAGERRVVFEGANLTVDGANVPTGGVIDRIEVSNFDGVTTTKLADFFSEPGSGHVMAVPFAPALVTGGGPNYLAQLLRGDNKFIGSDNDDTIQDDYGNNEFDFKGGFDTLVAGPKLIAIDVTSGNRPGDPKGIGTATVIDDFWNWKWQNLEKFNTSKVLSNAAGYNDNQGSGSGGGGGGDTGGGSTTGGGSGHPHIHAFDGGNLNFQAVGEFVMSRSTLPGETFEVQVRLGPIEGNAPISTIFAMAALVGDGAVQHKVTIDPARLGNVLWIDGAAVNLDAGQELDIGEAKISFNASRYLITYDNGQTVSAQLYYYGVPHLDVVVSIPNARPDGSVEGLIGNDDGNYANDFLTVAGTPATTYEDYYGVGSYADRWRITDATSLFDYGLGETTETFTDRAFPGSIVSLKDFPVDVVAQAAALVVAAGITDGALQQDAILDYLLTGNPGFIQSAANLESQGLTGDFTVNPPAPIPPKGVGVSAAPASVVEETGPTTSVTFKVFRIGEVAGAVDVSYAVVAPGAGYAGADDFGGVLPTGTVTIAAGQQSALVTLELSNAFTAATERVSLQITGATNAGGSVDILAPLAEVAVANADPTPGVPAQADIVGVTAGLALSGTGTAYVLDLGTLTQGVDVPAVTLALANVAQFGANAIGGTFATDGAITGYTFGLPATFSALAPGGYAGFTIDADTTAVGSYSETITIDLSQSNPSGFLGDLPTLTLTVLSNVVEATNRPPVAVGDTGATNEDTQVQFTAAALLANDSDPDNTPLTLTGVSNAVGGTAVLSSGVVTFTPTANAFGPASFAYTISDGQLSSTATVAITVAAVNDEQTAPATNSVTTLEDTASTTIAIGASDIDGDALSYAVKSTAAPAKGAISFAAGSFVYTPFANANGSDSFTILIDDGQGAVSEQVVDVTITPVNDAAGIVGTGTGTVTEDGTLAASGDLDVNDPDVGEQLFQAPASLAGTFGTFTFNATTGAWGYALANASAAVQALNTGDVRTDTLTVSSLDGTASSSITVTINGANEPAAGIIGTARADRLNGTAGADSIQALGGADTVSAGDGHDRIDAGTGNDRVNASGGNDTVIAASGDGTDVYDGGAGVDLLDMSRLTARTIVNLGDGFAVSSQSGLDDAFRFENVTTGSGADIVYGSSAANVIDAGAGSDTVFGGGGTDSFLFHAGNGRDVVLDFRAAGPSHDVLVFDAQQFGSLAALAAATTATAQGTLITIDADDTVLLAGVSRSAFLANLSTDVLLL